MIYTHLNKYSEYESSSASMKVFYAYTYYGFTVYPTLLSSRAVSKTYMYTWGGQPLHVPPIIDKRLGFNQLLPPFPPNILGSPNVLTSLRQCSETNLAMRLYDINLFLLRKQHQARPIYTCRLKA